MNHWPRGDGVGLRPLACWYCGFDSSRDYECFYLMIAVCCQVEVSASGWSLVQKSPTEWDKRRKGNTWTAISPKRYKKKTKIYETWSTSVSYLGTIVWISWCVWPPWLWHSCYNFSHFFTYRVPPLWCSWSVPQKYLLSRSKCEENWTAIYGYVKYQHY
jgi:hypothetical protein